MKCKKSSFVWILLSIIVLLTGMCSQIERTDSFLSFSKQVEETERIDDVNTDTLYFGNCTNKLITGLRDVFSKSRRGYGKINLKNHAEFLWLSEILQMLSIFGFTAITLLLSIPSGKTAILRYIHNQDGEKWNK